MAVAGAAAAFVARREPSAPPLLTGMRFEPSRALGDFSLIDQQGRKFGPANLRGHWTI